MVGEQVAAARGAELAIALVGLVIHADELFARHHADCVGLPQRERVDGSRGPAAARAAMAIAGGHGLARHRDLHRTAKTASFVRGAHRVVSSAWVNAPADARSPAWGMFAMARAMSECRCSRALRGSIATRLSSTCGYTAATTGSGRSSRAGSITN